MKTVVLFLSFIMALSASDLFKSSRRGRHSSRVKIKYRWLQEQPYEGMVRVPAGDQSFPMGEQRDTVLLSSDFYMDQTEVTQQDYNSLFRPKQSSGISGHNPVANVSWYDAVLYCNARSKATGLDTVYSYINRRGIAGRGATFENLSTDFSKNGYRLPTEAEWEFAYQTGSSDTSAKTAARYAWYRNNSGYKMHKVALKEANWHGLYDMAGNLSEWCHDWYEYSLKNRGVTDPKGPQFATGKRSVRGGSWRSGESELLSFSREGINPKERNGNMGFRCVAKAEINLVSEPLVSLPTFDFLDSEFFAIDKDVSTNQWVRRIGGAGVGVMGIAGWMMVDKNIKRLYDSDDGSEESREERDNKISSEKKLAGNLVLLGLAGTSLSIISLKF